nr:hypothetical protein L204_00037 [Cryptococcus depauperatus CBS 7855]
MANIDVQMPYNGPEHAHEDVSRRHHLGKTFEAYRAELDEENALREKLIMLSRSTTQLSKKLIFHLHRGATSGPSQRKKNLEDGKKKEREIAAVFGNIKSELQSSYEGYGGWEKGFWKWRKSVTPGLEEYIESLSFMWYLEHGNLIPLKQVQKALSDESGEPASHANHCLVVITPEDYILGMSDLTGELMRYATNALGTGNHEIPLEVCDFVRTVKTQFDAVNPDALRQLSKKQEETQRSLEKIEKVCYALRLRLIEFADRPDILAQMAKRALDDADNKGSSAE